jgi:glutathione S-transferase
MSPKIKLTYFDLKCRAELSRLILAQDGVEYEDCRITGAAWTAFKPSKSKRKYRKLSVTIL